MFVVRSTTGEEIVKEGEMDDRFYILVNGRCSVERHGKTLGSIDSGDCFGETSYVRGARRTATIRAETPVSVLRVSSTLLDTLLTPVLFWLFGQRATERLLEAEPQLGDRTVAGGHVHCGAAGDGGGVELEPPDRAGDLMQRQQSVGEARRPREHHRMAGRARGRELKIYVPDRMKEGYGPSVLAFERLKEQARRHDQQVDDEQPGRDLDRGGHPHAGAGPKARGCVDLAEVGSSLSAPHGRGGA